jgi:hypothetical protein
MEQEQIILFLYFYLKIGAVFALINIFLFYYRIFTNKTYYTKRTTPDGLALNKILTKFEKKFGKKITMRTFCAIETLLRVFNVITWPKYIHYLLLVLIHRK